MGITIIGDVHGKLERYNRIVDNCAVSICVGDFGFKKEWDWLEERYTYTGHRIIMGNHDYHPYRNSHYNSLGNWNLSAFGIFTVAGAFSIDKVYRIEGIDWFADEELTYSEGLECFDEYVKWKPSIVITHDCPQSIRELLFGIDQKSNTSNLLQAMFNEHQPDLWVFGHHHKSVNCKKGNTKFICLSELETLQI